VSRIERIGPHTPVWIYALCDPDTEEPRYVGKTVGYMCDRHKAHIWSAKAGSRLPVHAWIRGVIEAGKPLRIRDLELVRSGQWADRERFWIQDLRTKGVRLYNQTDGGEGLPGHTFSDEHKRRISDAIKTGKHFACETCGQTFWRKQCEIRKGNNRFCTRPCYARSLKGVHRPVSEQFTVKGVEAARAANLAKTHCKRGHPLSGDNLFFSTRGARSCKECRRLHKSNYLRRLANG